MAEKFYLQVTEDYVRLYSCSGIGWYAQKTRDGKCVTGFKDKPLTPELLEWLQKVIDTPFAEPTHVTTFETPREVSYVYAYDDKGILMMPVNIKRTVSRP